MEALGFVSSETLQSFNGTTTEILLQVVGLLVTAKSKLAKADKTALGEQISKIRAEISSTSSFLKDKEKELEWAFCF